MHHVTEMCAIPLSSRYECASHSTLKESCLAYKWVTSHVEWAMSQRWVRFLWVVVMSVRHTTYMNESCHAYKWVTSHIEWVMSHKCVRVLWVVIMSVRHSTHWMRRVSRMNESHHKLNESCHRNECDSFKSPFWVGVTSHIEWIMSRLYMSHVTRWMSDVTKCVRFLWVAVLSVRIDAYSMSHVTPVNELRHTCEWVTSHLWMSYVTPVNESRHTCEWVTSHLWMSHVTPVNESRHSCEWVTSHLWMSHVTPVHAPCHRDSYE